MKPDGFRNVIDALGGVWIDVPQDMKHNDDTPGMELHINLKKGYQLLDGDKAEQFCRFRGYPTADLGRIEAQQTFLKELFKQKVNAGLVLKATGLYKAIEKNVDVKTLSVLLGHADVTTTLNRYVHILDKQKREVMEKLLEED